MNSLCHHLNHELILAFVIIEVHKLFSAGVIISIMSSYSFSHNLNNGHFKAGKMVYFNHYKFTARFVI